MLDKLIEELRPEALIGAVVALLVLVLLAGYLYLLKPSVATYREVSEARSAVSLKLEAEGSKADQSLIAAREREIEELRGRLYGGSSEVPLKQIESYVIDALDRISRQRDVDLVSVTPLQMTEVLMFGELPYDVHVKGSYFQLFEWFQDVEQELRPMVVKEFGMDPSGSTGLVSLTLRLVAYRTGGTTS